MDQEQIIRQTRALYASYCHFFGPEACDFRREFRRIQQAYEVGYRHASDDPATRAGFRLGVEAAMTRRRKRPCHR